MMPHKLSGASLVAVVCAAQVLAQIGAYFWPALLPGMMPLWGLSNSEAGWITAIFYGAYLVCVPVLGVFRVRLKVRELALRLVRSGTHRDGMGVPGTLGPNPAGLASGEPGGARFTGACTPGGTGDACPTPGTEAGGVAATSATKSDVCPGSAVKKAFAMRASQSGAMGASGATGTPVGEDERVVTTRPLYL